MPEQDAMFPLCCRCHTVGIKGMAGWLSTICQVWFQCISSELYQRHHKDKHSKRLACATSEPLRHLDQGLRTCKYLSNSPSSEPPGVSDPAGVPGASPS